MRFFDVIAFKLFFIIFKMHNYGMDYKIISGFFNLIDFESAFAACFSLEFYNSSTVWA